MCVCVRRVACRKIGDGCSCRRRWSRSQQTSIWLLCFCFSILFSISFFVSFVVFSCRFAAHAAIHLYTSQTIATWLQFEFCVCSRLEFYAVRTKRICSVSSCASQRINVHPFVRRCVICHCHFVVASRNSLSSETIFHYFIGIEDPNRNHHHRLNGIREKSTWSFCCWTPR